MPGISEGPFGEPFDAIHEPRRSQLLPGLADAARSCSTAAS